MGLYMNGECNATNVQGKNYNLHKLQGGGARAPVPRNWWRHCFYIWKRTQTLSVVEKFT